MWRKYKNTIVLLLFLIGILQIYLYTTFPAFKNDDSPETITSAYTLGIGHPPGYPLFTMMGKVFSLLPVGSPAFRVNLFAIFLALMVLLFSYFIIRQITLYIFNNENKIIGFLGVFILAFSYIFWNQAIEAKGGIYILNLLFLSILIYLSVELFKGFNIKYLYLMSFIYGLSLSNHWPSMIILLPVFGYLFFKYFGKLNQKNIMTTILLLFAGLSPYLYLPVRAGTDGVFVFAARPNTWENLWWIILRTGYGIVPAPTLQLYEYQIKEFFTLFLNNYSILWLLIFAGGYIMYNKNREFFYIYLSAFLIITFMVVIYNRSYENLMWITDIFLMPPEYILMLFIIAGIYFILGFFKQKYFRYIFLALIFLLIFFIGNKNFEKNDSRYNYQAYDFGNNILKTMHKDSLYFDQGDNSVFPLYYIQIIEKQRQDINIVPVRSLAFKWGLDNLIKKYENISLKEYDPEYNLNSIITYCAGNNIEMFKSIYSPGVDHLKRYNFKQTGLLQEYLKNDKPMSPEIFELYSYNRGLYDKYIDYSRVTSDLVITYLNCMIQQGDELLHDGNPAGTIQLYKKAMLFPFKDEMKEYEPAFYYKLSYAYKDLNDKVNQIKYLKKTIGLKENYWQAYQELGEVYQKDGNLLMANEMFENTKKYGSPNTQVAGQANSVKETGKYLESGDAKYGQNDYKGAIEDYAKVIELEPEFTEAYSNRGAAKYKLGDYKGAIEDFNKAIELEPKFAEAFYNRGNVKADLSDEQGAIDDYTKAIELNPNYVLSYSNRGIVEYKLRNYKGAIEDYNKAIELNQKFENAYYGRGNAKVAISDYNGAIKDFDKVIELNPEDTEAYNNRGLVKAALKNYNGAIKDFNKAIDLNPKQAKAYFNRGVIKNALGDKQGAIEDLNKAGELGIQQAYDMIKRIQGN